MTDTAIILRIVELRRRRDELEAMLDENKKEAKALADSVIEAWVSGGVEQQKVAGATVSLRRDTYVSPNVHEGETRQEAEARLKEVLRAHGMEFLIEQHEDVASAKLAAMVREAGVEGLDPELAAALKVSIVPSLTVRLR